MKIIIISSYFFSKEFDDCCTTYKYSFPLRCSAEAKKTCLEAKFSDPEFYQTLAEEYLLERAHYRSSGIWTRRFNRGKFVSRPEESGPALDPGGKYRYEE